MEGREGSGGAAGRGRAGTRPPGAASAAGPQPAGRAAAALRRPAGACRRSGYALSAPARARPPGAREARTAGSGRVCRSRRALGVGASGLPGCVGPRLCQESHNLARSLPDIEKPDRTLTRAQSPRSPAHSRPAGRSRAPPGAALR